MRDPYERETDAERLEVGWRVQAWWLAENIYAWFPWDDPGEQIPS